MKIPLAGCFNARDLGGLPVRDGQLTRFRRLVRSDGVDHLEAADWRALVDHGIRTVIDLRNDDERTADRCPRPPELTTVHVPLDGPLFADIKRLGRDPAFWEGWGADRQLGTPLYYRAHLTRYGTSSAAVLRAIADAGPGGVLFHCVSGRDRTGQISMLCLALAGASAETIAADYALSAVNLPALFQRRGIPYDGPKIDALMAAEKTTIRESIAATLAAFDLESHLAGCGLGASHVERLRERLLGE